MSFRTPKYRRHKGSGQALVQLNGKRIYLGKYGTAESREKYRKLVAEFLAGGQTAGTGRNPFATRCIPCSRAAATTCWQRAMVGTD